MNDRLKFWLITFLQLIVFIGFTIFVYRGGFYDGQFNGWEDICGEDNVVLSKNINDGVEVIRCKLDSDFKDVNVFNVTNFDKFKENVMTT